MIKEKYEIGHLSNTQQQSLFEAQETADKSLLTIFNMLSDPEYKITNKDLQEIIASIYSNHERLTRIESHLRIKFHKCINYMICQNEIHEDSKEYKDTSFFVTSKCYKCYCGYKLECSDNHYPCHRYTLSKLGQMEFNNICCICTKDGQYCGFCRDLV